MSYEILKKHREIWERKKILQRIYFDWYDLILKNITRHGSTLEIGGGGGNFKKFFPDLISSDYTFCPWLDLNLDAHELPFRSNSLGNIVVIDVLHHLMKPTLFIGEAQRVLEEGGRLIMLEPYISPGSYLIYNYFHQEDVDFTPDVFNEEMWFPEEQKTPFDGNMAIPTQMFSKQIERFNKQFPNLNLIKKSCSDYFIYPLSGGFEHSNFIPLFALPFLKFLEKLISPLGTLFAFRVLIVLEKNKSGSL